MSFSRARAMVDTASSRSASVAQLRNTATTGSIWGSFPAAIRRNTSQTSVSPENARAGRRGPEHLNEVPGEQLLGGVGHIGACEREGVCDFISGHRPLGEKRAGMDLAHRSVHAPMRDKALHCQRQVFIIF